MLESFRNNGDIYNIAMKGAPGLLFTWTAFYRFEANKGRDWLIE